MAAGDRVVRVAHISVPNVDPVLALANWEYTVEDKQGNRILIRSGATPVDLGPRATAKNKTLVQINQDAIAAIKADQDIPTRDGAVEA